MAKRSYSQEYLALLGSFILIGLEIVVRGITLALRMFMMAILLIIANTDSKKLARLYDSAINVRGDCLTHSLRLKGGNHGIRRSVGFATPFRMVQTNVF